MDDLNYLWLFFLLLPLVSFMYASVGHGGASGYLALMALFSFTPAAMKPTALLLNLFVAAISFLHYYQAKHFNKSLFLKFAIASIPLAFVGGMMEIDSGLYKKILAIILLIAILRMLIVLSDDPKKIKEVPAWLGFTVGGIIGFFSGLIGIGGGIILTPIILLLRWGNIKEAAAVSALFIWVNSASGMAGQFISGVRLDFNAFFLVAIAIIGAYIGGYTGSKRFDMKYLTYMLAAVLLIASLKLFFT